jgi:hypothetical protein
LLRPYLHCIAGVDATPCGRQPVAASASRRKCDPLRAEMMDCDGGR